MFNKLVCVSIHTQNISASLEFYTSMGLVENWRIKRKLEDDSIWILIGLKFPERESSELVLSNHPVHNFTELEIAVDDVYVVYKELSKNKKVKWIRKPFATESNNIAVMEAPDGNVFVLIGKL